MMSQTLPTSIGTTGWFKPIRYNRLTMNVLGIHSGHDSSICLLSNGRIRKYFLTERFSRSKHDFDLPLQQIESIISNNDIVGIAVSTLHSYNYDTQKFIDDYLKCINNLRWYDYSKNHHISHASISYHNSGFKEALIFVIDAYGSSLKSNYTVLGECESVYKYTSQGEKLLYKKVIPRDADRLTPFEPVISEYDCDSPMGIGLLYDMAALSIGDTVDGCGKAMGLSSYGNDNNQFNNMFLYENKLNNNFFLSNNIQDFFKNPTNKITKENYKKYADFCHEVQQQTQKALGDLIEKWSKETGIKNICISGGYGMNVVANYYLLKRFQSLNFYFEPVCNDNGVSIGAAMHLYSKLKKWYQPKVKQNTTTSFHGYNYSYSSFLQYGVKESVSGIANKLKNNKSVAVYFGRAEAGQRALGNRSILFNALNPNAKDIVNKIKNREWYRPFAAVVLEEDANYYFDMSLMPSSPHMTVAFPVKTDLIPGVTHVDDTCRVQTVAKEDGHLYDLLVEFKKMAGHGILLNTSLNLAGDPLVETPQEAFNVLMTSELDYLWFPEINRVYDHAPIYNTD